MDIFLKTLEKRDDANITYFLSNLVFQHRDRRKCIHSRNYIYLCYYNYLDNEQPLSLETSTAEEVEKVPVSSIFTLNLST